MDNFTLIRIGFTINVLVDQVGTALFLPLIYVIIKYKKLHDAPCLKLIGLLMCCYLCSKLIIILPYLIVVLPLQNVPLVLCVAWQLLPMTFSNGMRPLALGISFDRFVSIFFPIWYATSVKRFYFISMCAVLSIFPLLMSFCWVWNAIENPLIVTNCTTAELFGQHSFIYENHSVIDTGFHGLSGFFYALIILKFLWLNKYERADSFKRQPIFVCVAVIVSVQVIGMFTISYAYRYIPRLFAGLTENQIPLVYYGINCFSSLTITAEFVALYFTSTEHRMTLKKEFPGMFGFVNQVNGTHQQQNAKNAHGKVEPKQNANMPAKNIQCVNVQVNTNSNRERMTK